jgi:hypothetical protein
MIAPRLAATSTQVENDSTSTTIVTSALPEIPAGAPRLGFERGEDKLGPCHESEMVRTISVESHGLLTRR